MYKVWEGRGKNNSRNKQSEYVCEQQDNGHRKDDQRLKTWHLKDITSSECGTIKNKLTDPILSLSWGRTQMCVNALGRWKISKMQLLEAREYR